MNPTKIFIFFFLLFNQNSFATQANNKDDSKNTLTVTVTSSFEKNKLYERIVVARIGNLYFKKVCKHAFLADPQEAIISISTNSNCDGAIKNDLTTQSLVYEEIFVSKMINRYKTFYVSGRKDFEFEVEDINPLTGIRINL